MGGINDISILGWRASDDTILYMATYRILLSNYKTIDQFGSELRKAYLETLPIMENRHPGTTTVRNLGVQQNIQWNQLPYDASAIGAGSAMRSGCIGIFLSR